MKFTILHILCEGQTEEKFTKEVLSPYLQQFYIFPKPILLLTSKKKNARGGMLSYAQCKRDLNILIKRFPDNSNEKHIFTTMFDYYALPDDFPGFKEAGKITGVRERVDFMETMFSKNMNSLAFIPYIQLHEFEALLFSDITKLIQEYPFSKDKILQLKEDIEGFNDPELINNSQETAPSKRIIKALETDYRYNKVKSGASVTAAIGIDILLSRCQHFREWINKIKDLVFETSK